MNKKVIQSYVWNESDRYFVSTIERECSSAEYQERYNETIVWEWPEGQERGSIIGQYEDNKGSIEVHLNVCRSIKDNVCAN